jgi:hypothetical protein
VQHQGDEGRREDRQQAVWGGHQGADADDDGDVPGGGDRQHRADDDRLAHHRVDVVQAVLQDRGGRSQWDERQGEQAGHRTAEHDHARDQQHQGHHHRVDEPEQLPALVALGPTETHHDRGGPQGLKAQIRRPCIPPHRRDGICAGHVQRVPRHQAHPLVLHGPQRRHQGHHRGRAQHHAEGEAPPP